MHSLKELKGVLLELSLSSLHYVDGGAFCFNGPQVEEDDDGGETLESRFDVDRFMISYVYLRTPVLTTCESV